MEVIVGHLGRLEFMTSGGTAFNRIGELVRLARVIVRRACNDKSTSIFSNLSLHRTLANNPLATPERSPNSRRKSASEEASNILSIHEESTEVSPPTYKKLHLLISLFGAF